MVNLTEQTEVQESQERITTDVVETAAQVVVVSLPTRYCAVKSKSF